MMRTQALILVGHGSQRSAGARPPIEEHAEQIRSLGAVDEVVTAFWKEKPEIREALGLVSSDDVYVVPLFLAEGYFTREVIPRELGIAGPVTEVGERTVHYCPPIGAHPSMVELVLQRARQAAAPLGDARGDTALVIIGHGTERSPTSGDTVHQIVESLGSHTGFATVRAGFLDEEPEIGSVIRSLPHPHIVLVPFFASEGWHAAVTIPRDLGIGSDPRSSNRARLYYTPPVGTLPEVASVSVALARVAGARPPI